MDNHWHEQIVLIVAGYIYRDNAAAVLRLQGVLRVDSCTWGHPACASIACGLQKAL